MAQIRAGNESPIVTQRYLNTASYAGDPTPGAVVSTANVSGSIIQPYSGQVGGILTLGRDAAAYYSDPGAYTLYAGDYQYVQFDPLAALSPAVQGQVVFWKNNTTNMTGTAPSGFLVTTDMTGVNLPNIGEVAGIALTNTVKANYWFIQVSGIAQVKFKSSIGAVTPVVGDLVFVDYTTPSALADDPVQTTSNLTLAQWKTRLGTAWQKAPVGNTITPVLLNGPSYIPGGGGGQG